MQGYRTVPEPAADGRPSHHGRRTTAGSAHRVGSGQMSRVLTSALSLPKSEAGRRVRAAEAVGPRTSMLGAVLEPVRPVLAAAQRAGEVSAEKVAIIADALDKVDRRGFDPADIAAGEKLLTEHATVFPPEDLRLLAAKVVDAIDPDGTLPHDELNKDRRYLHLKSDPGRRLCRGFPAHRVGRRETQDPAGSAGQTADRPGRGRRRTHLWAAAARCFGGSVRPAVTGRRHPRYRRDPGHGDRHHRRRRPGRTGRPRPHRRRHPDPHRQDLATGEQRRDHPRRAHRHRRGVGSRPQPADRQPNPNPGPDRPGRGCSFPAAPIHPNTARAITSANG